MSDRGRQTSEVPQAAGERAISPVFLLLMIAFLALAVAMVWRPDYARSLAFPFVLVGYLIALCLHEFGHAIVAYLTLNLLHYTNVQYSILFPLVIMAFGGISLPGGAVYINNSLLRRTSYSSLVSAGGPLLTAAVLVLLMLVLKSGAQPLAAAPVLQATLAFLAMLQVTALLFNLIPCPGLDGWGIIAPFLPRPARNFGRRLAPIAPLLMLVALFYVPGLNSMLWEAIYRICEFVGLDPRLAFHGYHLFQFWRGI
jgi:Zn-dependent protease